MTIALQATHLLGLIGRLEYGDEPSKEAVDYAKEHGFIIVFGHSDDCMEIRGAIYDEFYSPPRMNADGVIYPECDCNDCPHEKKIRETSNTIGWAHEKYCHEFYPMYADLEPMQMYWKFYQMEQGEVYAECFIAHLSIFGETNA